MQVTDALPAWVDEATVTVAGTPAAAAAAVCAETDIARFGLLADPRAGADEGCRATMMVTPTPAAAADAEAGAVPAPGVAWTPTAAAVAGEAVTEMVGVGVAPTAVAAAASGKTVTLLPVVTEG